MRARSLTTAFVAAAVLVLAQCQGENPVQQQPVPPASPSIELSVSARSFSATAGAANPAGQMVQITNGGAGSLSGLAATATYAAGQPVNWLSLTLTSTTAPSELHLTANTASLPPGSYQATVSVTSTAATNSPRQVNVTLAVAASATIELTPASRSFTATVGASPAPQTVDITNGGTGPLSGLGANVSYAAGQPAGWLALTIGGSTAPATLLLTPSTAALAAGTYHATVSVTSPMASNSPRTLAVTLTVTPPAPSPLIVLSASSRSFSATQGGANPAAQSVQVTNGGGGTLSGLARSITYQAGQPAGWLTATLSGTTAPSTLSLSAATGTLAAGTYNASVAITSAVAANSPQHVAVTFTVTAPVVPPVIAVSVTQRNFSATAGGANPVNQQAQVANSGGGTLSGIQVSESPSASWLAVTLSSTTAPATITFQVTTGTLAAGTYGTTVLVSSPVANNSPVSVAVTFTVAPAAPAEITVYASEDNTLIFSSVDATLGNRTFRTGGLEVGCNFSVLPYNSEYVCGEALMRFNVQSQIQGRTIVSAELRLYPYTIGADQQTSFRVAAVARTWSTTTVTFNSFHNGSEVYTSGQVQRAAPTTMALPFTLDVTTIVRNWANGSFANNGLLLWDTVASFPPYSVLRAVTFDSAEWYASLGTRPQLVIRFQ
jgi:hypothetical protein